MKQELIKPIVKVGNSAGIILPKEWLNGKAKVKLIETPKDIKKELLEILDTYLSEVQGVYLTGSHARNEQTDRSDIDVLVITNRTNKKIEIGKYNILLIPLKQIEKELENNALPLLPMLKEAKAIMNEPLITDYNNTPLTKKNLKYHIELIKSALAINREMIKLDKEWPSNCSDAVAYSLVLNLRTVYIINKLRKNEKTSNKEIISLIKRLSGSLRAYEGYLRVKSNGKTKEDLPVEEAEKLYNYLIIKLGEIEKWLKGKKD